MKILSNYPSISKPGDSWLNLKVSLHGFQVPKIKLSLYPLIAGIIRTCSSVVSDLCSETKRFQFELACYLCAELNPLQ